MAGDVKVHVLLNKDHPQAQAAMLKEPTNHLLLISYVAHAIADKIVTTRDDLLEQLLPGGRDALEDVNLDARLGTVVRQLVDRVKTPQ